MASGSSATPADQLRERSGLSAGFPPARKSMRPVVASLPRLGSRNPGGRDCSAGSANWSPDAGTKPVPKLDLNISWEIGRNNSPSVGFTVWNRDVLQSSGVVDLASTRGVV